MLKKIHNKLRSVYWLFYKSFLYFSKSYSYDGLKIEINKNVFHPGLLYSTKNLYNFIKELKVKNSTVLELGAGSGLISLDCARRGAFVTASDINSFSVITLKNCSQINNLQLNIIESDLFDYIPPQIFSYIFINPPYYKSDPKGNLQSAFYAGADFEYFRKLFSQVSGYIDDTTFIYMVLADNCKINEIEEIAKMDGFEFILERTLVHKYEENYIFQIKPYN